MVQKFIVNIDVPGVGVVDEAVLVPLTNWSILTSINVMQDDAIVSILTLGIVDAPAPILRAMKFAVLLAPLSNLNFLVRVPAGTEDITGFISGLEDV